MTRRWPFRTSPRPPDAPAFRSFCGDEHPAPVREAALRCLVSLTYVDRILDKLAEARCIPILVARLASSEPPGVRSAAEVALLNVSLRGRYKAQVASAGGVEASVALLGSDNPEVRARGIARHGSRGDFAPRFTTARGLERASRRTDRGVRHPQERDMGTRLVAALGRTEARAGEGGDGEERTDVPHLLGMLQMDGNIVAQKSAAEQLAREVRRRRGAARQPTPTPAPLPRRSWRQLSSTRGGKRPAKTGTFSLDGVTMPPPGLGKLYILGRPAGPRIVRRREP